MTANTDEKIQLVALQLGYEKPKVLNAKQTLKQILKERKLKPDFDSAFKLLNENRHLLTEDICNYWLKVAEKKLKK